MQATQQLIGKVPQTTKSEFDAAVKNASETFKTWKEVPISARVRHMLKYQDLLKQHQVRISCKSRILLIRTKSLPSSPRSTARV